MKVLGSILTWAALAFVIGLLVAQFVLYVYASFVSAETCVGMTREECMSHVLGVPTKASKSKEGDAGAKP